MTEGELDLDKQCILCLQTPRNPSNIDLEQGKHRRPWGLRHAYGPLCLHCKRMSQIRYGFMNTPKFVSGLDEGDRNKSEARVFALAWLSLREEGRVRITFGMLEARGNFINQILQMAGSLDVARHGMNEYMLLADYVAANPQANPIDDGFVVVQLRIGGKRRLGLQVPVVAEDKGVMTPQWAPKQMLLDPAVGSDEPSDVELARALGEKATPLPSKLTTPTGTATPPSPWRGNPTTSLRMMRAPARSE